MNIDDILDSLDELLDRAWNLPLTGGRCVVDAEKVRDLIDDIRLNMPAEIKQAKQIVADRADIISVAKAEAESIVRKAEDHAKTLVEQEEITRQAQARATEILTQAQMKSREMRQASQEFAETMLKSTEETLSKALGDVKSTHQALKSSGRNLKK
ncbi:MAG: ATPase [Oscillospiraceae bacterium]|nr:ATPase [Oscillospiraceae bacterium]